MLIHCILTRPMLLYKNMVVKRVSNGSLFLSLGLFDRIDDSS